MQNLKFGLAIPYGSARNAARMAQLAEQAGWAGLFLGDAIWCEDPMIALAAAGMVTERIRLGIMVIPAPLRRPWKIASEALALDRLSNGRMLLGLGAGAVWMGWHAFPDAVQDAKIRGEMLDETIDIITLLFNRVQADYAGKHFSLKLTHLDMAHYPPAPVQQPRIPIWVPGLWPSKKSLSHVLKADGVLPEKFSASGKVEELTPADVRAINDYVAEHRELTTPFDIVVTGQVGDLSRMEQQDKLSGWQEAGTTWWVESMWSLSEEQVQERIAQGPPVS